MSHWHDKSELPEIQSMIHKVKTLTDGLQDKVKGSPKK